MSGVHSKAFFSGCLRKCDEMLYEMLPVRRAPACTVPGSLAQCAYMQQQRWACTHGSQAAVAELHGSGGPSPKPSDACRFCTQLSPQATETQRLQRSPLGGRNGILLGLHRADIHLQQMAHLAALVGICSWCQIVLCRLPPDMAAAVTSHVRQIKPGRVANCKGGGRDGQHSGTTEAFIDLIESTAQHPTCPTRSTERDSTSKNSFMRGFSSTAVHARPAAAMIRRAIRY